MLSRKKTAIPACCSIDTDAGIGYTPSMKRAILFVLFLCVQPLIAHSHPGKTDWRGGHQCLKGCEEWGLSYKEYHLHDKDWKPIRVGKTRKLAGLKTEPESTVTGTAVQEVPQVEKPKIETVTTQRYVTNIYEENVFLSNPLLFILLILLLLLLILRMNRKREQA